MPTSEASSSTSSHWAWRLYAPFAMVLGLGSLAILCLAWTPFALVAQWIFPPQKTVPIGRLAIHYVFRIYTSILEHCCGCRFDLKDLEALAKNPNSMVVVANHPSLIDAVLIASRLPNAVCIMKGALVRNILLGAGSRMAGYIVNDSALTVVRRGVEALKARPTMLVIFPEGSRTRNPPVDTCQSAAGVIAARAGVPVAVLTISMSSPYLGKQFPLLRPPVLPLSIQVKKVDQFMVEKQAAQGFGEKIAGIFSDALTQPESAVQAHAASSASSAAPAETSH